MNWIEYYLPKVNNKESEKNFKNKYRKFLNLIVEIIGEKHPSNIVELGCGTGIITKMLLMTFPPHLLGDKNFILSDVSDNMINLSRLNMCGMSFCNDIARRRMESIQYVSHDIQDTLSLEYERWNPNTKYSDLFITHGVLEHFSKDTINNILANIAKDSRVLGHIHYVPTDEYTTKSFGDENLWSVSEWLELTNPEIAIKNGPDLFLYIKNKKDEIEK